MRTIPRSGLGIAVLAFVAGAGLTGCATQSDYAYGPGAGFYDECDDGYCVGYPYGQRFLYLQTPGLSRTPRLPVTMAKHPPAPRPVVRGTTSAPMARMASSHVSTHSASGSASRR
jgi:hypothetical protein